MKTRTVLLVLIVVAVLVSISGSTPSDASASTTVLGRAVWWSVRVDDPINSGDTAHQLPIAGCEDGGRSSPRLLLQVLLAVRSEVEHCVIQV